METTIGFQALGDLGSFLSPAIMEYQMETTMEREMETG